MSWQPKSELAVEDIKVRAPSGFGYQIEIVPWKEPHKFVWTFLSVPRGTKHPRCKLPIVKVMGVGQEVNAGQVRELMQSGLLTQDQISALTMFVLKGLIK